jgi:hypothetical protein
VRTHDDIGLHYSVRGSKGLSLATRCAGKVLRLGSPVTSHDHLLATGDQIQRNLFTDVSKSYDCGLYGGYSYRQY